MRHIKGKPLPGPDRADVVTRAMSVTKGIVNASATECKSRASSGRSAALSRQDRVGRRRWLPLASHGVRVSAIAFRMVSSRTAVATACRFLPVPAAYQLKAPRYCGRLQSPEFQLDRRVGKDHHAAYNNPFTGIMIVGCRGIGGF